MSHPPHPNAGHGQVWPRPDGRFARCGGQPEVCTACAADATRWYQATGHLAITQWQLGFQMFCVCGRKSEQHLRHRLPGSSSTGIVVCPRCLREYVLLGCAVTTGPRLVLRTQYEALLAATRQAQQAARAAWQWPDRSVS